MARHQRRTGLGISKRVPRLKWIEAVAIAKQRQFLYLQSGDGSFTMKRVNSGELTRSVKVFEPRQLAYQRRPVALEMFLMLNGHLQQFRRCRSGGRLAVDMESMEHTTFHPNRQHRYGKRMIGLVIGAGILGIIITVMEDGDFPGWFSMIVCVLAALIPAAIINAFLPSQLFIVGLAVGAAVAGLAISALCGMSVKRASIAAGIYLAIQASISIGLSLALS